MGCPINHNVKDVKCKWSWLYKITSKENYVSKKCRSNFLIASEKSDIQCKIMIYKIGTFRMWSNF